MMPRTRSDLRLTNRCRTIVYLDFEGFLDEVGDPPAGFDVRALYAAIKSRADVAYACAYGDWSQYREQGLEIARAGFDLVQVFDIEQRGDCASAIHLAVDALNYVQNDASIDTVYLVSEGVDFSPLTRRLREKGVKVVGIGLRVDEEGWLEATFDPYHAGAKLSDPRETNGFIRRTAERPAEPPVAHAECYHKIKEALSVLRRDGHEAVNGATLLLEVRRIDPQFDPAEIGFGDLGGLLQMFARTIRFERRQGELWIATTLRDGMRVAEEPITDIKTAADYAQLLSKLQLRVTARGLREPVIQRIFHRVQEAADRSAVITAGDIEEDLLNEFDQSATDEHREALRNTLRVLFVNRAFRLDNVDDGYQSPLTFNRHYIRTVEDLQNYYVESILCAVKNMVRERGGTQVHLELLAELLFDDVVSVGRLREIEQGLRGAERPFKKPPRYGARWTPPIAVPNPAMQAPGIPTPGMSAPAPTPARHLVREEIEGAAEG